MPTISLKEKFIRGAFWNAAAQFGTVAINLAVTILLARLLSPAHFGLLAMVLVIASFLGYFSEFGFMAGIIRKEELNEADSCTAFWSSLALTLIIYFILYLISPLIAAFYKQPELVRINRVLSLMFVAGAYSFVPIALEMKELRYRVISMIEVASLLVSGTTAVVLALLGWGIWALVFQHILQRFSLSVGCFLFLSWRPAMKFSMSSFRELFGYGFHMTINNIIKFFSENIDHLIVGKLLGTSALGFYTMAFRLSRFPLEKIWRVFGTMLFPAFASIQNQHERTSRNYLRVTFYGGFLLLPFIVFLVIFINPLIRFTIGEKWLPAGGLIRIFSIYILFYSFSFGDEPILMLRSIRKLNAVKLTCSLAIVGFGYAAIQIWQIEGMAWAYSICLAASFIWFKLIIKKQLGFGMAEIKDTLSRGRTAFFNMLKKYLTLNGRCSETQYEEYRSPEVPQEK